MEFKNLNCPVCGKQLINLTNENFLKLGYHYFWCDVCNIDINIEEKKIFPCNIYDDKEEKYLW